MMFPCSPLVQTNCTYTGPCYRGGSTSLTITGSCYNCPYHRDNRIQTYYVPKKEVEPVEQAKVKAKQLRDGLKNLPGNRKSMRY